MNLEQATIKALTETFTDDIEAYASNNNFKTGLNQWECTVKASKKAETLADKYGLKYYMSADIEAGPLADNPDYYDVVGDLEPLVKFHKELTASENKKYEKLNQLSKRSKITEGNFYYKINDILQAIDASIKDMNQIQGRINKLQSTLDDSSKIDALDKTVLSVQMVIQDFEKTKDNLKKLFPQQLRLMTDEEKAMLDKMKANGEID